MKDINSEKAEPSCFYECYKGGEGGGWQQRRGGGDLKCMIISMKKSNNKINTDINENTNKNKNSNWNKCLLNDPYRSQKKYLQWRIVRTFLLYKYL